MGSFFLVALGKVSFTFGFSCGCGSTSSLAVAFTGSDGTSVPFDRCCLSALLVL